MVFKRTKTARRKTYKRKRMYRKKRVPRPLGRPARIVRSAYYATITASNSVNTFGSFQFKLSDLPDYTEFTTLFDEYQIYKIQILFLPRLITQSTTTAYNNPWFLLCVDHDDATAATTTDQMLQYPSVRILSSLKTHRLTLKPKFSMAIYNGVTDAYGARNGYIDCANASVPHYGVKWAIDASTTAASVSYGVWVKYHVLLKGVR